MITATIAGNVGGKDAETRQAGSGVVTSWSVAVEQRGRDGKKTQWVNCSFWGKRGEAVAPYITRGGKITVTGEMQTREHDGKTYLDLNVYDLKLQGGKQDEGGGSYMREERQQDHGAGAGGRPGGGYGDDSEIPFNFEGRL